MEAYLAQLMDLLRAALNDESARQQAISSFQETVWRGLPRDLPEEISDVLRTAAYDLDFYEPDPLLRAEDPSYYGSERLETELRGAISELTAAVGRYDNS